MDDQEKQPNYRILLIIGIISMAVAIVWFLILQIDKEPPPEEAAPTAAYALTGDEEAPEGTTSSASTSPTATKSSSSPSPTASPSSSASATPSVSASPSASASASSDAGELVAFQNNIFTLSDSEDDALNGLRVLTVSEAGNPLELQRVLWQFDVEDENEITATWNGRELGDHDIVGTGTILELSGPNGLVSDRAVVVVPGDVTGSGQLDDGQLAILTEALDNPDLLTGAYLLAADMDGSGEIDIADLRLLGQAID